MDVNYSKVYMGNVIKEKRINENLSLESLANSLEISVRRLVDIEAGKYSISVKLLVNLCNTLNLNPSNLIKIK